jgi:hypothetical protein
MCDCADCRWPNEPALVLSHSVATDPVGRSLKSLAGATPAFHFYPSSLRAKWEIGETLTSLLNVRQACSEATASNEHGARQTTPITIQLCSLAGDGSVEDIVNTVQAVRQEYDRSFLSGTTLLLAYTGAALGATPGASVGKRIASLQSHFDLVVVFSDGDTLGRRYRLEDALRLAAAFLGSVLGSCGFRELLFDFARRGRDGNRLITFGVARLDVSLETFRSTAFASVSQRLFEFLFSSYETEQGASDEPREPRYLTALQRSRGGKLQPVVSAVEPAERQLGRPLREARALEHVHLLEALLWRVARIGWFRRVGRGVGRVAAWPVRMFRPKRGTTEESATSEVEKQKAGAFEQLLRLKQVELELQPAFGVGSNHAGFPLEVSLSDAAAREDGLQDSLPDIRSMAWTLSQETPLDELLSGHVTAERFVERVEELWHEHEFAERVAELSAPDRVTGFLQGLASRVVPLFPLADGATAKVLIAPAATACDVALNGFETTVGLPGEYTLVVISECSDLSCLGSRRG